MSRILNMFGVVLLIYGIILCLLSNLNLGVVLVAISGVFFLVWGKFYNQIKAVTSSGIMKCVKYIIIFALCCEITLLGFIAVYGMKDTVTYKEDAVVVLGAGIQGDRVTLPLKLRLDKAIEYAEKNPHAMIVVTGGQGFQETVTEAYAMEKYLIENGIDKSKIIKEEKATSTNENMRFSKEILDKYFGKEYEIAVITNNFHIYRGVCISKSEGFENITHLHAGLQWYNILPCYLRESLAVLKMWVIG